MFFKNHLLTLSLHTDLYVEECRCNTFFFPPSSLFGPNLCTPLPPLHFLVFQTRLKSSNFIRVSEAHSQWAQTSHAISKCQVSNRNQLVLKIADGFQVG